MLPATTRTKCGKWWGSETSTLLRDLYYFFVLEGKNWRGSHKLPDSFFDVPSRLLAVHGILLLRHRRPPSC
jgi:hypothetical protein